MSSTPLFTPSISVSHGLIIHLDHHSIHQLSTEPALLTSLPAPLTHALVLRRSNVLAYTTNHLKTVYIFNLDTESGVAEIDLHLEVMGLYFSGTRLLIRCKAEAARLEKFFLFEIRSDCLKQVATYDSFADAEDESPALNCVAITEAGAMALRYTSSGCVIYYNNIDDKKRFKTISCHKGKIQAIALSEDGKWMATCSQKGTLIRIWRMDRPNGKEKDEPVQTLRRGSYESRIYSLSFSKDNRFLIVTSDSITVHIFAIHQEGEESKNYKSLFTWGENEEKSFAWFRYSDKQVKRPPSVATFVDGQPAAWVVSEDGDIMKLSFDPEKGGECKKVFQRKLFESNQ